MTDLDRAASLECEADRHRAMALRLDARGRHVEAEIRRDRARTLVRRARGLVPRVVGAPITLYAAA
ncbi:MAG: hypothetical protein AAF594_14590 [Bacteroidota bacterium]